MRFRRWMSILPLVLTGCARGALPPDAVDSAAAARSGEQTMSSNTKFEIAKTEEEWRGVLTPEQYQILREKGTERPGTGKYANTFEAGTYVCAGCGQELFKSDTKFDAGCGWPSFYDAIDKSKITAKDDYQFGMHRIEVMCAKCGGHLGHVFPDGPQPTGQRYCINSASLNFHKAEKK